jgi:transcriptional regulator with XRE-family HTH domain
MKIDVIELGKRLEQLRELRGESLHSTALKAGIAKSYLAKLERGQVENPGLRTLASVAGALSTTVADLLAPVQGTAATAEGSGTSLAEYEQLVQNLPRELRSFIEAWERDNDERLPADVIRSLATIQFRGKRPQSVEDWRFVYYALRQSTR